jgi:hypothetical protein
VQAKRALGSGAWRHGTETKQFPQEAMAKARTNPENHQLTLRIH